MKRSNILFLLLLGVSFLFSTFASAQQKSANITSPMSFYFSQKQTNWCWAACNQMLLNSIGVNETQENQVVKLFGQIVNQGAGPNYEKAKLALNGSYTNNSGVTVTITPYVSYLQQRNTNDPVVIIEHLENGIPIVMATQMHGRVCVGVDYIQNGQFIQITTLRLLDPARPGGIITYTMQQFLAEGLIGFMTFDKN
jgi:hypothetical protein